MNNQLFVGDTVRVLQGGIACASVDLTCLDPPFYSKRDYNLLFKTPKPPQESKTGKASNAVTA